MGDNVMSGYATKVYILLSGGRVHRVTGYEQDALDIYESMVGDGWDVELETLWCEIPARDTDVG